MPFLRQSGDISVSYTHLALNHELHRKVKIKETGSGAGTIEIAFYSREELSELADLLADVYKRQDITVLTIWLEALGRKEHE